MAYSKNEQIKGLREVSDDLYKTLGFLENDTRNEILKEVCPIINYALKDLGIKGRLDDAINIYKNDIIRGAKEDIIESTYKIADILEEVANVMGDEETPFEAEERFEKEVLSQMSLEDKEDKPGLRLLFSVWIDTQVREGKMTEELASNCTSPIDCY